MPTLLAPPVFEIPPEPVRKFSVDEYHQMIEAGILTGDDAVELLEGWIVPKMPHKPLHDSTVQFIDDQLRTYLPTGWRLRVQCAVTLPDSEPEPDVVVAFGDHRTFRHRHPGPDDIGLVVEVSDSTLRRDRTQMYAIYARAGIAHYWIVHLVDKQVEAFSQPRGAGQKASYRKKGEYRSGRSIGLNLAGDHVEVAVDDLIDSE